MNAKRSRMRRSWVGGAVAVASVVALWSGSLAGAAPSLVRISSDPYTNTKNQHRTEVEPDTFSAGGTVVSVFQVGRGFSGGASNIGWAVSGNGGSTWTHGFLPATTVNSTPPNPTYADASDASIAYDAKHQAWVVSYLDARPPVPSVVDVLSSRSTDGGKTWGTPVVIAASSVFYDKNWTVCDNTATSPFYGNCYTEFDNASAGDLEQLSTSHDGAQTWGPAVATADQAHGLGGQPLVQPNGTVVVPYEGFDAQNFVTVSSFSSTDGGASLTKSVTVSADDFNPPNSNFRSGGLPSAEIDKTGKVYVTWADCRFESNCGANDLVLSTSSDGAMWSPPRRIPVDPVGSGIDHFIPGLAVDKSTGGRSAHLALAYYYFTQAGCTDTTCRLDVGYLSSTNGGASWSDATKLAGPMHLDWLADTSQGRMVGDYISTSISGGNAVPVVATASAPTGAVFHESMAAGQLPVTGGSNPLANDVEVSSGPASPRVARPSGRATAF